MKSPKLKTELLRSRSPEQWQWIKAQAIESPLIFEHLVQFSFDPDGTLGFRASWIMDNAAEKNPSLVNQSTIEFIAKNVVRNTNYSVIRSCLRFHAREKLPEENLGLLTDQCFQWLAASSSPIAVKVHAMQILFRVTLIEPDLSNELKLIIEEQLPMGSAGFKSRGKKIIAQLEKQK